MTAIRDWEKRIISRHRNKYWQIYSRNLICTFPVISKYGCYLEAKNTSYFQVTCNLRLPQLTIFATTLVHHFTCREQQTSTRKVNFKVFIYVYTFTTFSFTWINNFSWEYSRFMEKESKLYICWYHMSPLHFILINCLSSCKYLSFILSFVLFPNDVTFVTIRNRKGTWVKKLCDTHVFAWILYIKFN